MFVDCWYSEKTVPAARLQGTPKLPSLSLCIHFYRMSLSPCFSCTSYRYKNSVNPMLFSCFFYISILLCSASERTSIFGYSSAIQLHQANDFFLFVFFLKVTLPMLAMIRCIFKLEQLKFRLKIQLQFINPMIWSWIVHVCSYKDDDLPQFPGPNWQHQIWLKNPVTTLGTSTHIFQL